MDAWNANYFNSTEKFYTLIQNFIKISDVSHFCSHNFVCINSNARTVVGIFTLT